MLILGIETSCDETALALVADGKDLIGSQVASSLKDHQRFGGVVPEIASRAHVELLTAELEVMMERAGVGPSQIDRIAVTRGPGLPGSLVIGVAAAKALGLAWRKPVMGINHLHAHLYAATMESDTICPEDPMVGLVISGGHTALIQMKGLQSIALLGQTQDDAVGEAFDKVAKLLGLGFPGGPEIQRVAQQGNPKAFRFAASKIKKGTPFDFSLSGIKTAVLYKVRDQGFTDSGRLDPEFVADMAASFQNSIVEEVVMKTIQACSTHHLRRLVVGGGVMANRPLRERLTERCVDLGITLGIPRFSLCTDNGAMVAGLAHHLQMEASAPLEVSPNLRVELN